MKLLIFALNYISYLKFSSECFFTYFQVSLAQGIPVMLYTTGTLMQFYMLCSSVQKLLDAVRFITIHYINYFYFVSNINDIEKIFNRQILCVLFLSLQNSYTFNYYRNLWKCDLICKEKRQFAQFCLFILIILII